MDMLEPLRRDYYYAAGRRWLFGRPVEMWVRYRDVVARFVKDLKPIPSEHLVFDDPIPVGTLKTEAAALIRPRPFPGGLRMPHLHLADRVYQLDQAQWKAFSGEVVKNLQERLARAGSVGLDDLIQVSDAMEGLG